MKRTGSWPRKAPLRISPSQRSTQLTRTATTRKRPHVTPEERNARTVVRARSGGVCECCGQVRAASMHHRRKTGRVWTPENLLHTCGSGTTGCHGWIETHPAAAIERGWWVPSHADPATTPAWLHRHGLVLLTPDGSITRYKEEAA